jgi:hypothetical protein
MSINEFSCLSNALLRASARCVPAVTYEIPALVRQMVGGIDAEHISEVSIHQCPREGMGVTHYRVEVTLCGGKLRTGEFDAEGSSAEHETYVLYDRMRDGVMKHLHLLH